MFLIYRYPGLSIATVTLCALVLAGVVVGAWGYCFPSVEVYDAANPLPLSAIAFKFNLVVGVVTFLVTWVLSFFATAEFSFTGTGIAVALLRTVVTAILIAIAGYILAGIHNGPIEYKKVSESYSWAETRYGIDLKDSETPLQKLSVVSTTEGKVYSVVQLPEGFVLCDDELNELPVVTESTSSDGTGF